MFGWTDQKTEANYWYDRFFEVWRPKPKTYDDLYPSWSTSGKYAVELMDYLVKHEVEVQIYYRDKITVSLLHKLFIGTGTGETVPQALSNAIGSIEFVYLDALPDYKSIKEVLKNHE